VRRRRGRRAAGRRRPPAVLDRLPDPELHQPARGRAHGRRVQPGGRRDRRVPASVPARAAAELGRAERLADHLVRRRRDAGARDRARRDRRPVPQGHEAPVRLYQPAAAAGARRARDRTGDGREGRRRGMIEVKGLTVRYGGVTSLDGMDLLFERGVCGLIGPNGAGKTTFFNVLSGFVRPASGSVTAFGDDLLRMAHYRRARWGIRRTFQTEQAISALTVYDNVAMIHSRLRGAGRRTDILEAIEFVGGGVSPWAKVGSLTAGQRRLVEVARASAGKPR